MLSRSSGIRRMRSNIISPARGTRSRCHGSMTGWEQRGKRANQGAPFEPLGTTVGTAQDIVVEPVFLIPHAFRPRLIHGTGDPKEMFNELDGHVFVERVVGRQLHGDLSHVLTEKRYPGSAVSLLEMAAGGQRRAAVEDTDIIQPQESALEEILAEPVFAVDPPTEIQH